MQEISLLRMPVGIFKINSKKEMVYVNPFFCKISGYPKLKLLGKKWLSTIHPDDYETFFNTLTKYMEAGRSYKFEFRFTHERKGETWVLCHVVPENHQKVADNYIGTITDISKLKKTQASLLKLARFDPLTKLPNRYLFEDLLVKSLARAKRNKNKLALFYIDIDFFKKVNDFLGHTIGDEFLREIAKRLKKSVRTEDFIVRLGGDEFAIILENIKDITHINIAAQRLVDDFNQPFIIGEHEIISSLSVGISVFPDEKTTKTTIVQHADQALYQAKAAGRNCFKYYNKTMQHQLERYMQVIEQLRHAISQNQFELFYQPKISAVDNSLVGIEALLRWKNKILQNPSPAEFIPIAEESGLMNQIGDWVISTALHQFKEWYENISQMRKIIISINISPSQLNDSSIIGTIMNVLKETNVPTQNILFELTETAVMKKAFDSKSVFQVFLMELGIGISIDDFGTGYSSLTYLKQLPIKELKIDKSFIDDIGKNKSSEVIIKAIINLALTLDLEVIAEGVETKAQLVFLKKNQCKIIQGYYFSKPLNATDMTAFIDSMPIKR